ncbi:MAG: GNAT family N-acetyltransferase [Alphaproteobacteria bacterium]|nr:GNAT family N-acetyltransferase [Alphaproteobacteria bacterium]
MQVALDTSCVINLLSHGETTDAELLQLVRLALEGRIRVNVTDIVEIEIPEGDTDDAVERRGFIRQSLEQFPVSALGPIREAQRDRLATGFLSLLWPNIEEGSRKHANSLRDCKHLASHNICGGDMFVTRDARLATKAMANRAQVGVDVLSPADALARLSAECFKAARSPTWDQVVRKAQNDDKGEIKRLLEPIKGSYDDFDAWLAKAMGEKEMWVAHADGRICAVAVWSEKTSSTVKLATFFVGEEWEGRGLGGHLLFHQLRLWVARKYTKVFVTVSSERLRALTFFLTYGFRIEGSSGRRYKSDAVEFVLGKHLFYQVVRDADLDTFLSDVGSQVFDLPAHPSVRQVSSWFLPPTFGPLASMRGDDGVPCGVQIESPHQTRSMTLDRFEEVVYPARIATKGRQAFLIPIQPGWADAMMKVPRRQGSLFASTDKLALRTDNAYYCTPRYADVNVGGSPALFYVSQPDKMIAGFARIVERRIAEPEDLFLQFDRLGIYGLDNIRGHVRDGRAMVIRFAWWVPFDSPIELDRMRCEFTLEAPQTIRAIDYDLYERLLAAGGVTW